MSSEQDKDLVAKKCMLHAEHTAGSSDHISFRAESLSKDPAPLAHTLSATH